MPGAKARHQAFVDFMIPIVKGCSTETAQEVASLGIQVHGGMGFIEETGAAQHYRDARIMTIYEGTTGIQANDFIGRKTARDGGAVARRIADEMEKVARELSSASRREPQGHRARTLPTAWRRCARPPNGWSPPTARTRAPRMRWRCPISSCGASSPEAGSSAAARWRRRGTSRPAPATRASSQAKIATARFYAEALLPQSAGSRKP